MNKVVFVLTITFLSKFAFAQDSDKICFITDQAQSSWLFGESKISNLEKIELAQLEKLIQAKIDEYNKKVTQQNNINSDGYFRQYIVVENEQGEKEVWINFLCDVGQNGNWKTQIIMVEDGGKCYFNIAINLAKKTISRFAVNGRA